MPVYFDPKTHDIWTQSNIPGFHKNHVEVDEVLAPILQELNARGYKTEYSCSGHSIEAATEILVADDAEAARWDVLGCPVEKLEAPVSNECGTFHYRAPGYAWLNTLYISFASAIEDSIAAPLPAGFVWEDRQTIRYSYSKDLDMYADDYEFFEERLKACRALYQWAKTMPSPVEISQQSAAPCSCTF